MNNKERIEKIKELMIECYMDESIDTYEKRDKLKDELKNLAIISYYQGDNKKKAKTRIRNKIKSIEQNIEEIEHAYNNRKVFIIGEDDEKLYPLVYNERIVDILINIKNLAVSKKINHDSLYEVAEDLIIYKESMKNIIEQLLFLRNYNEFINKNYFSYYHYKYLFWNIQNIVTVYFKFDDLEGQLVEMGVIK